VKLDVMDTVVPLEPQEQRTIYTYTGNFYQQSGPSSWEWEATLGNWGYTFEDNPGDVFDLSVGFSTLTKYHTTLGCSNVEVPTGATSFRAIAIGGGGGGGGGGGDASAKANWSGNTAKGNGGAGGNGGNGGYTMSNVILIESPHNVLALCVGSAGGGGSKGGNCSTKAGAFKTSGCSGTSGKDGGASGESWVYYRNEFNAWSNGGTGGKGGNGAYAKANSHNTSSNKGNNGNSGTPGTVNWGQYSYFNDTTYFYSNNGAGGNGSYNNGNPGVSGAVQIMWYFN
jgi:hypothetical protein